MSGLTLTLVDAPDFALDMSVLTPAALAGKRLAQIRAIKLQQGRKRVALGDLFEVSGEAADDSLTIDRATRQLHRLGYGLTGGLLQVNGDCGDEAGLRMRGGALRISGNAGDGVGLGMRGGLIEISGSAGDFAGGPAPGDVTGMKNGSILIGRHLGRRAGERMRRGLIVVGGNVGEGCGSQMVAGSIVVLGHCGPGLGAGMRRGSIVLAKAGDTPGAGFTLAGEFELAFLPLLINYVASLKPGWRGRLSALGKVQRWVGDAANGGMGEILIPA